MRMLKAFSTKPMSGKRYSNIIGFDDAPFDPEHRGAVAIVGAVFAGLRLDGVLMGEIEKDGIDSAEVLIRVVSQSKFAEHAQLIMLQGIAFGGFNVVDVFALHEALKLPVLVVSRRLPDMEAIRKALTQQVPDGEKKWAVIARLGPMEAIRKVYVQRVGISLEEAESVIERFAIHSHIPEPIRVAHLIASALVEGESRGDPGLSQSRGN
jgi:endonuclease V-like protein UPF0215 family